VAETIILGGLLCIVAAIVGGGVKLFGAGEVPVINSGPRQLALGCFGAVLVGAGIYLNVSDDFRVTDVRVTADQMAVFLCPSKVSYTAVITVAGSGGTVEYRFVHNGTPLMRYSLEFNGPGGLSIAQVAEVRASLPGLPRLGPDRMALEVLAPNYVVTTPAETPVLC
jgi:hypothetical protein